MGSLGGLEADLLEAVGVGRAAARLVVVGGAAARARAREGARRVLERAARRRARLAQREHVAPLAGQRLGARLAVGEVARARRALHGLVLLGELRVGGELEAGARQDGRAALALRVRLGGHEGVFLPLVRHLRLGARVQRHPCGRRRLGPQSRRRQLKRNEIFGTRDSRTPVEWEPRSAMTMVSVSVRFSK